MPHMDLRTAVVANGAKLRTSGRRVVTYKDATGRSREALVLGAGSSSGLKLAIASDNGRVVDNVPKATTAKSTSSYIAR